MSSAEAPKLEYGAQPGRRRARRWVKRLSLGLVIGFALFAGWRWGAPYGRALSEQVQYLSMQRRWLDHVDPPERVAFETDPAEVARLKAAGYADASIPSVGGYTPPLASAGYCGGVYDELDRSFRPNGGAGGWAGGGVLLRRLRTAGGTERVVLVASLLRQTPPDGTNAEVWWFTGPPATLRPGTRVGPATHGKIQPYLKPGERVRIYAGQPDPADAARFTVVYFVNDEQGHLDGRLGEDGTLDVVIRDGPLQGLE